MIPWHNVIHNFQQYVYCLLKGKSVYENHVDVILTIGDEWLFISFIKNIKT